jgi:mycothiol synthase
MADGAQIRPPTREEVDAILDAVNAHTVGLYGIAETSRNDVLAWLDAPNLDAELDIRLVVLPDGSVAGYGDVSDDDQEHRRYWLDVRMRPGQAGSALLQALEQRALETAGPGAVVRGFVHGTDEETRRLFKAHGYRVIRHSLRMAIELDAELPVPVWPEGSSVRTFEPGVDDERVYEAHQQAFADHWEFSRMPYEEWRHWLLRPPFDPSLWWLARDGEEIAGVCLCRPELTGEPDKGWVSVLGVRPRWRRRGLALALLTHAFAKFRRRGKARVGLGVDAETRPVPSGSTSAPGCRWPVATRSSRSRSRRRCAGRARGRIVHARARRPLACRDGEAAGGSGG